jgi:perosamine synthetase
MSNVPIYEPWLTSIEENYAIDAIKSHWISSLGKYVEKSERTFADFIGRKYCILVNNGTAACHVALSSLGIGSNDEVIVPALTFISTIDAVTYTGAKPVIVDVDKDTWNINIDKVKKAITNKTKAIFCVHLYGNLCDIDSLKKICFENDLYFIEDACEAVGSYYDGKHAGTFGDVAAFSFFSNKTICCGEGGAVVIDFLKWKERAEALRCHGQKGDRYFHEYIGNNYRLNNVSAAILYGQIERINEILKEKYRVRDTYKNELDSCNITWQKQHSEKYVINHWLNTIIVENRDLLIKKLNESGIDTRKVFYPICDMPQYRDQKNMPEARFIHEHGISLPSYPTLEDDKIKFVCKIVKENV